VTQVGEQPGPGFEDQCGWDGLPADPAPTAETSPTAWQDALTVLYEDTRRTITAWLRDADRSAHELVSAADSALRQAHRDADRIREEARVEAGRILALAEMQAGQIRSQAQIGGAERQAEVEVLRHRVDSMSQAIDNLLQSLEEVMGAVGSLSRPALGSRPAQPELPRGPAEGAVGGT